MVSVRNHESKSTFLDNNKDDRSLHLARSALVGGASGFCTRTIVHPFDVVKIRFQLQWEGLGRRRTLQSRYFSMRQAFYDILHTEGPTALWKGHVPAQLLSIIYSSSQFYTYDRVSNQIQMNCPQLSHVSCRFLAGGCAGLVATLLAQPLDTIRTRFIAQGKSTYYANMPSAISQMFKEGGIACFYKGFIPTMLEIFPSTGIHFMVFYTGKEFLSQNNLVNSNPMIFSSCNFALGLAAGLVAKVSTHPLDVFKKRMQIQGFQHARAGYGHLYSYVNFRDCVASILREEGFIGLYKGLLPNIVKASLSSALHFTFYEFGCYLLETDN